MHWLRVASPLGRECHAIAADSSPRRHSMFRAALMTALVTVLALPAPSLAKDPLLSGYAGPGGGEQVLLGTHLSGGASGGDGSGSATTAPAGGGTTTPDAPGSLRAPAPTAASAGAPSPAPTSGASSGARSGAKAGRSGTSTESGRTGQATASPAAAAPRPVAYPTRADDAGGFPLSAAEILVGALALLAVAGMSAWMRRAGTHGGGPGAQASA